jgi:hypothetical protein
MWPTRNKPICKDQFTSEGGPSESNNSRRSEAAVRGRANHTHDEAARSEQRQIYDLEGASVYAVPSTA